MKGFTLLEVLMAVLIFALSITSLVTSFNAGLLASTDKENVKLALNIAQTRMEEAQGLGYGGIADSGPVPDPDFPGFSVTTMVSEKQANLKRVDVKVAWNVQGGQTDVTLTSLLLNPGA
jgi:prepilin-type N-terminal cleavage/methylation domain-containing protein